jgi:uncharacterized protein (TIGR02246 family)
MTAMGQKRSLAAYGRNGWKADIGELARSTLPVLEEEQQKEGPMTRSLLLLSVTALLLPACQAGEKPANDAAEVNGTAAVETGADEQAIRGHVDHWLQLVKAKDAAGIAELYAEDGAVMPPNAPIGKGRAAIEQTWASMMRTPGFDLTFVPEQIIVSSSGDMALDRGTYRLAVAPDGTAQTDTGKYVVVWRKIGSEWKAAADIFNSDLPTSGG